jgi:hypothetical protein
MTVKGQFSAFADRPINGRDAPIPDLPALTPERAGSTLSRRSGPRQPMVGPSAVMHRIDGR